MPFRAGGWEIILVLLIVLIIFGAGRLPEIGGAMGKAIREFKHSSSAPDEPKAAEAKSEERRATADSKEVKSKAK